MFSAQSLNVLSFGFPVGFARPELRGSGLVEAGVTVVSCGALRPVILVLAKVASQEKIHFVLKTEQE